MSQSNLARMSAPMAPLFFDPDPEIPDAATLGYGDLVFNDGRREFLNGDPELAATLPPVPQMQLQPPPLIDPVALQKQPEPLMGADGQAYQLDQTGTFTPVNSLALENPTLPPMEPLGQQPPGDLGIQSVGPNQPLVSQTRPGMEEPAAAGGQSLLPQSPDQLQRQPEPLQGADGQLYQVTQTGEFVPYQREGALPPDVAARQLGELGAMQQQTLQATEQARADEVRILNEATLKAMAENEAQKAKLEDEQQEQQHKIERWQREQQDLADMKIDQSLVGARGVVGGIFAVLGATLLGGAGSDAGLRMIDSAIDRSVREQVRQRDTKLGLLADKIGSSQQAIRMGKAELYKVAADRAELLTQKTKNDVYEAQSPAIIQSLRQKQLQEMQEAEKLSLGKVTERVPAPPKPPDPKMLQRYGELRRERDAASDMVTRMENQIGLIWEPGKNGQPGHYRNGAEVIKNGIEGIGAIEQWVPDFVYSTLGQKEGYQVRGAKQALAFAIVRQMQPTGPITDVDRKVGEIAATMDTEAGLVQTLERLRNSEEQQRANDAAQYRPEVVAEYERQYRASGGQSRQGAPAASRPAALGDLPGERQRRRPQAQGEVPEPTPEQFRSSVQGFAEGAGLNPDAVLRVIQHESGGKPGATNQITGKHAGLIQFNQQTWEGLAKEAGRPDLSWEDMRKMSAEEQLPYVMTYFRRLGLGPDNDAGDYAMAAFMPAFWNKPDDFVLGRRGSRESIGGLSMAKVFSQNPGLQNGDTITVGDVRRSVL